MIIRVHFFAQIKEAFGQSGRDLELPAGATAGEAAKKLMKESAAAQIRNLPLSYAVNDSYASADSKLNEGDELVLLPPVAGG